MLASAPNTHTHSQQWIIQYYDSYCVFDVRHHHTACRKDSHRHSVFGADKKKTFSNTRSHSNVMCRLPSFAEHTTNTPMQFDILFVRNTQHLHNKHGRCATTKVSRDHRRLHKVYLHYVVPHQNATTMCRMCRMCNVHDINCMSTMPRVQSCTVRSSILHMLTRKLEYYDLMSPNWCYGLIKNGRKLPISMVIVVDMKFVEGVIVCYWHR